MSLSNFPTMGAASGGRAFVAWEVARAGGTSTRVRSAPGGHRRGHQSRTPDGTIRPFVRRSSDPRWGPLGAAPAAACASASASPPGTARAAHSASRGRSAASRHGWGDTESRSTAGSRGPPARGSRDRWGSPRGAAPVSGCAPACAVGLQTTAAVALGSAWAAGRAGRRADRSATTATPNSPTPAPAAQRRTWADPPAGAAWPVDGVAPAVPVHPGVAWPIKSSQNGQPVYYLYNEGTPLREHP